MTLMETYSIVIVSTFNISSKSVTIVLISFEHSSVATGNVIDPTMMIFK